MITNIISERKLDIISDFIARYGKIAITCHVSPDGDAMGSTLGLCHFLKGLGKQATVVIPDMPPRKPPARKWPACRTCPQSVPVLSRPSDHRSEFPSESHRY